ncbi:MAG: ribosome maturation factor RimM [Alphaproteobacteria bacterium]|nr:ribosome maturation factor RimM [Alphaproteobacteria bacterium]
MSESKKILVGKIVGAQGLRGEVRVQTYTQNPQDFAMFKVQSAKFNEGDFKFVRAIPNSTVIIAKVDGTDDRNAAEGLRDTELFIDRDALPALSGDEYYVADLIGMKVVGANENSPKNTTDSRANFHSPLQTLTVIAVHNFGAGDILELSNGEMVSFAGAKVDVAKRIITFE